MRNFAVVSAAFLMLGCAAGDGDVADDASDATLKVGQAHASHAPVCPGSEVGAARCHAHVIVDGTGQAQANLTPSGYGPAQLQDAYNVPATGATTTIAIVDAYGYSTAESDLATYRAQFGLPACTTANGCFKKVNQNGQQGNYPRDDIGWSQETALDLDMASAMCPSCKLLLVEATSASFGNLAAAVDTAVALGATVVSNSYGGGESGSSAYESHYNHAGVAITVSSGDSGFGVQFPASSPHVTAVGGTRLTFDGTSYSETAWSGAGSGCSAVYAKPAWQQDPGCANRTVADVSAVADPNTGVAVFAPTRRNHSGWLVFGGTSVAAPLIAGIYGATGGTFSGDASGLYGAPAGSLNDIVGGSNGSCSPAYLCTAVAGYDGPTGLGTPNGTAAF